MQHCQAFWYWPEAVTGGEVMALPPRLEAHARALRLKQGEVVAVFDGHGHVRRGHWLGAKAVALAQSQRQAPPRCQVSLYIPLLEPAAMAWLVEKATELGLWRLQPILSQHSQPRSFALAKLQARAVAAAQQCGGAYLPQIEPPLALAEALAQAEGPQWLTSLQSQQPPPAPPDGPLGLWVGPEGDWSESEHRSLSQRALALSLSPRVLRAETAALCALALCQ